MHRVACEHRGASFDDGATAQKKAATLTTLLDNHFRNKLAVRLGDASSDELKSSDSFAHTFRCPSLSAAAVVTASRDVAINRCGKRCYNFR